MKMSCKTPPRKWAAALHWWDPSFCVAGIRCRRLCLWLACPTCPCCADEACHLSVFSTFGTSKHPCALEGKRSGLQVGTGWSYLLQSSSAWIFPIPTSLSWRCWLWEARVALTLGPPLAWEFSLAWLVEMVDEVPELAVARGWCPSNSNCILQWLFGPCYPSCLTITVLFSVWNRHITHHASQWGEKQTPPLRSGSAQLPLQAFVLSFCIPRLSDTYLLQIS